MIPFALTIQQKQLRQGISAIIAVDKEWEEPSDVCEHRGEINKVEAWLTGQGFFASSDAKATIEPKQTIPVTKEVPKEVPKSVNPNTATVAPIANLQITRQTTWRGRRTQAAENDEKDIALEGAYAHMGAVRRGDMIKIGVSHPLIGP